jgi:ring-1,2-phenylacetyl-CoA epoxidase subunit PaaD
MAALATHPSIKEIWCWLEEVPDPEIPVVSVVELGIVRDVSLDGAVVVVTVTPTYSGCPATAVIAMDIEQAIRKHGVDEVRIETKLSPAWTTDWITEAAREKLKAYGIAPPEKGVACAGALRTQTSIKYPLCGSANTECISQFGSTPCKAHYRCKDCLEPFDYFKSF